MIMRSDVFGVELLGQALCFDVVHVQPDLGADAEIWGWNLAVLHSLSVLLDCNMELVPQILMESIEIIDILLSHIGADVIDSDLKPGMISFICKKRGYLHCGVQGIVIHKFCKQ